MAWIESPSEDEAEAAEGRLGRLLRGSRDQHSGRIDAILRIHGLRPETLDGHLRLYRAVMHTPGGLSRRERETIAVAVSAFNHCRY